MAVLPSLVTVADLALRLGRTFTPEQQLRVQALLDDASSIVRGLVRQDISRLTTTDTFPMRRADMVLHRCGGVVTLPQRPVVDIADVSINGVPTVDWWQEGQDLLLRSWAWAEPPAAHGPPKVTVTYTHGWDPVPGEIRAIVVQAVNRSLVNPSQIRSETVGGESVTYLIPTTGEALGVLLSKTEEKALKRFRGPGAGTVNLRRR